MRGNIEIKLRMFKYRDIDRDIKVITNVQSTSIDQLIKQMSYERGYDVSTKLIKIVISRSSFALSN